MLVMANKQDLPRAMSVSDVTEALALSGLSNTVGAAAQEGLSETSFMVAVRVLSQPAPTNKNLK